MTSYPFARNDKTNINLKITTRLQSTDATAARLTVQCCGPVLARPAPFPRSPRPPARREGRSFAVPRDLGGGDSRGVAVQHDCVALLDRDVTARQLLHDLGRNYAV